MQTIERIRRLAGLKEARQVMDPDEEDRLDDAQQQREAKIGQLIRLAFHKIGLAIADEHGVFYDEANNREVIVTLDDNQVDLDLLSRLKHTGLADRFQLWATNHELSVMFMVRAELDDAVL